MSEGIPGALSLIQWETPKSRRVAIQGGLIPVTRETETKASGRVRDNLGWSLGFKSSSALA